jgi:hypothetical protein
MKYLAQFEKVIDRSPLSDVSKKTYKARLRRLTTITKKDVDWIIMHCKETYDLLSKYSVETIKGYVNTVLTLFKHAPILKTKKKHVYRCWYKVFDEIAAKANEKYNNMQASDRQKDSYVSWAEIITKRDSLVNKSSQDYLLLCMYTMIPPSRADMNMIKIYDKDPEDTKTYPNYMVVYNDKIKLVYNEFKSKSKRLQRYEKILPAHLETVVRKSLTANPREFLIVSPRTGLPYHNACSFSKYFDRLLEKHFKKKVTINTLRHSFVNSLDMNKLTPGEKDIIARDLMHSKDTMDKYRLSVSAQDSNTGKAKICEVVCRDAP